MRLLKEVSGNRLTVIDQGVEFIGKRVHNQILWDDGAVWFRLPALSTFNGHWCHEMYPEMVASIMDTRVQMADGFVTTLVPEGDDGFHILLNGERHHAQRRGNFLHWSGGDVWIHVQGMRTAFDGRWQHKSRPEVVEIIHRGLIHRPDGTVAKITPQGADKFTVELSGQVLEAELKDGEISWSDGGAWLAARAPAPLNGRWSYNRDPATVLEICGDFVKKPDGSALKILQQAESGLSIVHAGKRLQASLHGNELLWQDGAVWSRLEEEVPQSQGSLPDASQSKEGLEEEEAADGGCDSGGEQKEQEEKEGQEADILGMQEEPRPNVGEVFTAAPEAEATDQSCD